MKTFNTIAICVPSKHYMVDISDRVKEIKNMVDSGKYFTINRARQYGKTTTLYELGRNLSGEYDVIILDFQELTYDSFKDEDSFAREMAGLLCDGEAPVGSSSRENRFDEFRKLSIQKDKASINELFRFIDKWCSENEKPVVLIIDEVDSATNNQIFLDFLAKLRACYLKRERIETYKTFWSVILAGVTDVKNLKRKIKKDENEKDNSPWNIASDFLVDMSLSEKGIKGMLGEYELDHNTGMDTAALAKALREYTNGYPYLVSRICEIIDTRISKTMSISKAWTMDGFREAIKLILKETDTLFQSLAEKLESFPSIRETLRDILMDGMRIAWNPDQREITQMQMYGFVREENGILRIDNRIFETRLYNYFLSSEEIKSSALYKEGDLARNKFVENGKLNMRMVLQRFAETYTEIFGPLEDRFKEKDGREQFLLFLKPIINGTGNYYIEAQTRDQTRTDVIVDYLGQQYVIELKIWRGERYNSEGEKQISEYLNYFGLDTGYMLSFNFNKKKENGMHRVEINDKVLFECVV